MKPILENIDFADSSYKSCETVDNNLIVYFNSWDDRIIKIIFNNAIQFTYKECSTTEGVYEQNDQTILLNNVLNKHYVKIPEQHSFKVYNIIDIDDCCFFEVVAEGIVATKD